ncbi:sugar phosphate isomerase/epimerase family protein [Calycomorphotria hydatis]|uniref:Xylose isomerase-like TIM barrel n=1 Tax=Calycomorphotria hydatis TaxID=2528027 RepID=A0A517TCQ0_9PLAN|nr:TIM barrel protein [Calycomorphotria hydatis]QDT66141.1 Xylose isomerase-like TIM barrel [Calycomorphotria hydatis]
MSTPLQISIPTRLFGQKLRAAVESAATMGVAGVQFDLRHEFTADMLSDSGCRQLSVMLSEHSLRTSSCEFPLRKPLTEQHGLEERMHALFGAIESTAKLKSRLLCFPIGHLPPSAEGAEHELLVELLNDLARKGDHVGVSLAILPQGESTDVLASVLSEVHTGQVGLNLDAAAIASSKQSPTEVVARFHDRVLLVRVRDAVRELSGSVSEVPVGRGEVEWAELLAVLGEANFAGWYVVDRTEGSDPQGDASRAISYLHNVAFG